MGILKKLDEADNQVSQDEADKEYERIPIWKPNTAYAADRIIRPKVRAGERRQQYRAINSGTSGAVEPVWDTKIGAEVQDNDITWACEVTNWEARLGGYKVGPKDLTFAVRNPKMYDYFARKAREAETEAISLYYTFRSWGHSKGRARMYVADYLSREYSQYKRANLKAGEAVFVPLSAFGDAESAMDDKKLAEIPLDAINPIKIPDNLTAVQIIKDFIIYMETHIAKTQNPNHAKKIFTWMIIIGGLDDDIQDKSIFPFYNEVKSIVDKVSGMTTKKDPAKTEYLIRAELKMGVNTWNFNRELIRKLMKEYYKEKDLTMPIILKKEDVNHNDEEGPDLLFEASGAVDIAYYLTTDKLKQPKDIPLTLMSIIFVAKKLLPAEYAKYKKFGDTPAEIIKNIAAEAPILLREILGKLRNKLVNAMVS